MAIVGAFFIARAVIPAGPRAVFHDDHRTDRRR